MPIGPKPCCYRNRCSDYLRSQKLPELGKAAGDTVNSKTLLKD